MSKLIKKIPPELKELLKKDVKEIKVDSLESYHNLARLYNELRLIEKEVKENTAKEKEELTKKLAPYTTASKRIEKTIKHVKDSLESFYNSETSNGSNGALTNGAYRSDYVYYRSKPEVKITSEKDLKTWLIQNGYDTVLDINISNLIKLYKESTTELPHIEVYTKANLTNKKIK